MEISTLCYRNGKWSRPFPTIDSERTLVLAFAAPSFADRPELLAQLTAAYPRSHTIGCSTAGEIDEAGIHDDSMTVAVARFDATALRCARAPLATAADSFAAGAHLAEALRAPELRAIFVLSKGVDVNGSELVRGLNAGIPSDVIVTGGLAGDGDRFGRTWVLAGGRVDRDAAVAVGLYGSRVRIGHGSMGGWDTFGPERVVTASSGNVLHELDGRPALTLYKEYLGARAADLPGSALLFPLALRTTAADVDSVVRTVLSIDEATQSMVFAGDIPKGSYAKLMRANFDRLILGAQSAAGAASFERADGTPGLCIAISCVGRRLVLGARSEEETEATFEMLPRGTAQVGFYSYGELSPNTTGRCDLHNQTMTLTVVSEEA